MIQKEMDNTAHNFWKSAGWNALTRKKIMLKTEYLFCKINSFILLTNIYLCGWVQLNICIYLCVHLCMYMCECIHLSLSLSLSLFIYLSIYLYIYIYIYIYKGVVPVFALSILTSNSEKRCYWALKLCIHFNMFIRRKITKHSVWFFTD